MAPLLVADPRVSDWRHDPAWHHFRNDLRRAKELGVRAISVDVWWGLVQPTGPDKFEWSYYETIFREIVDAGLQVTPILSTHRCGGNVGDTVYVPLPSWFIEKMHKGAPFDLRAKSEAGNWNDEVASIFADRYVLDDYVRFWTAFRNHFASQAKHMPDILVGMGPAGELVYPAYHLHDRAAYYQAAAFPNHGSMQAASPLALAQYEEWLLKTPDVTRGMRPPTTPEEAERLLRAAYDGNPAATTVFRWYHDSLLAHGMRMGTAASGVFHGSADTTWNGTRLGFKIPGVHWRYFDRAAQLKAGWLEFTGPRNAHGVPLAWQRTEGGGFATAFDRLVLPLRTQFPRSQWQTVFTCAELENCWQGCQTHGTCRCDFKAVTGAGDLVDSVGTLADRHGVPVVLENALAGSLWNGRNVNALRNQLSSHHAFEGVTLLRLFDVVNSEPTRNLLQHPPQRATRRCSLLLSEAGQDDSQPR